MWQHDARFVFARENSAPWNANESTVVSLSIWPLDHIWLRFHIWSVCHNDEVSWAVEIGDEFEPEFDALHEDVQTEILALSLLLQQFGPQLGRPRVDTLNGSCHANMKELRFSAADGEWRVAFALRPEAQGDPAGGRRQVRGERKALLPRPY